MLNKKKAAYSALADVLENDASRKELIEQLRKAAATPPQETVPTLTPPPVEEQKTVLENITDVSRHYGEALSSRFAQLYRNLMGSQHKAFNPHTFTAAATQFLMLAAAVFIFYWLVRCAPGRCTAGWATGGEKRTSIKTAGCTSPLWLPGRLSSIYCCWH